MKKHLIGASFALVVILMTGLLVNAQIKTADPGTPGTKGGSNAVTVPDQQSNANLGALLKAGRYCMTDNYGYQWDVNVDNSGNITGIVKTKSCGIAKVSGTVASRTVFADQIPSHYCCDGFYYVVTWVDNVQKTLGGTWRNTPDCGGSGVWSGQLVDCPK